MTRSLPDHEPTRDNLMAHTIVTPAMAAAAIRPVRFCSCPVSLSAVFRLSLAAACLVVTLAHQARAVSPVRQSAVVSVIRDALPSVINIHGQKTVRGVTPAGSAGDFRQVNGMGTAVVIDPRGYLLTNYHVVEDVNEIRASLSDRRTATARLIAADRRTDLAILKIDVEQPLPVVKMGTSADLMLGETVIAIGNAYGWEHSATIGIISQLHREVPVNEETEYHDMIQTSADINPGNSGGPLLNVEGDLIGINAAVRVGAQGIAFAIPIDQAIEVAARLCEEHVARRVEVGIKGRDVWSSESGRRFVITELEDETLSAGGLAPGAAVIRVGEQDVQSRLDFALALLEREPNEQLPLTLEQGGQTKTASLTLDPSSGGGAEQSPMMRRIWSTVGLQVKPITPAELRQLSAIRESRYEGGLRVLAVRAGSTAGQYGIETGDILIGVHQWQTPTVNDLDYILRRPEVMRAKSTKFYIVRGGEMYEGLIRLTQSQRRVSR